MTSQCLSLKNLVPCLVITQVFSCFLIFLMFGLKRKKSGATLPSTWPPRPPRTPTPTRPLWTEGGLASKSWFGWILWRTPACDFQQNYAFGFWCLDPARGQEQPTFEGKPFEYTYTWQFSNPLSGLSSDITSSRTSLYFEWWWSKFLNTYYVRMYTWFYFTGIKGCFYFQAVVVGFTFTTFTHPVANLVHSGGISLHLFWQEPVLSDHFFSFCFFHQITCFDVFVPYYWVLWSHRGSQGFWKWP